MTCLSSSPPAWPNPPPAGRGRGARFYPPPGAKRIVGSRSGPQHYTPILQKRASYIARMQQRHSSSSISLFDMKSPMSQCIDTIIGAAEAVNRRDAWLEDQFGAGSKRNSTTFRITSRKPLTTLNVEPKKPQTFSSKGTKSGIHIEKLNFGTEDMISEPELEKTLQDKELHRNLVLMMALERPRKEPVTASLPSLKIGEGFYWKEYPILENILFDQMAEYYQFSSNSRQSKNQQAYNNSLVEKVRSIAASHGYTFDPAFFSDKRLRDRVRCFYKTHLQNAKKRLCTMQKHIQSKEQRRVLQDLIIKTRKSIPKLVSTFSTDDEENKALASVVKRR